MRVRQVKFDQPTRQSLIFRLHDVGNQAAWGEFVEIYEPMIERIAIRLGMQRADAVDATQEVLLHLTKVVDRWKPIENSQGSFRGWLYRVARNVMIRWMQGHDLKAIGTGHVATENLLKDQPDRGEGDLVDLEFQRQVFAQAADNIQSRFHSKTWHAFWQTLVNAQPIDQVAAALEMSPGAVYVARSRVMKQLRSEVQRICDTQWESISQTRVFAKVEKS